MPLGGFLGERVSKSMTIYKSHNVSPSSNQIAKAPAEPQTQQFVPPKVMGRRKEFLHQNQIAKAPIATESIKVQNVNAYNTATHSIRQNMPSLPVKQADNRND